MNGVNIAINPGSGSVAGSTLEHAEDNMKHFLTDCSAEDLQYLRAPNEDSNDGRYAFFVYKGERCHIVQMPGLPLSQVRFMDPKSQDAYAFPRLYVDGSSWLWKYGLLKENEFRKPCPTCAEECPNCS